MNSGDVNFSFTDMDISNHVKATLHERDIESHIIDNKGDSSDLGKVLDSNFSERLANFMKNSKNLLENIDKKHSNVRFEKFEKDATKDGCLITAPESPTHTLMELEDTLTKLDDFKSKNIEKNDNRGGMDVSKNFISLHTGSTDTLFDSSPTSNNKVETPKRLYCIHKNSYPFQNQAFDSTHNPLNSSLSWDHLEDQDHLKFNEHTDVIKDVTNHFRSRTYSGASDHNLLGSNLSNIVAFKLALYKKRTKSAKGSDQVIKNINNPLKSDFKTKERPDNKTLRVYRNKGFHNVINSIFNQNQSSSVHNHTSLPPSNESYVDEERIACKGFDSLAFPFIPSSVESRCRCCSDNSISMESTMDEELAGHLPSDIASPSLIDSKYGENCSLSSTNFTIKSTLERDKFSDESTLNSFGGLPDGFLNNLLEKSEVFDNNLSSEYIRTPSSSSIIPKDTPRVDSTTDMGLVSIDLNEKENFSEISNIEKNVPEKESKYVANKNYNFKEALRIDQLEHELFKMKSYLKEKDKKISILEASQNLPEKICKSSFKSIGVEVNAGYQEDCNFLQKQKNEMLREKITQEGYNTTQYKPSNEPGEYLSIKDYDPNNSSALKNKIKDLESQIQDLQEANENAAHLMISLKQNNLIEAKNSTNALVQDLIDQNNALREEVDRLHQFVPKIKTEGSTSQFLRKELENLKEDLYTLKHQNNLIVLENITLKNQLKKERNLESHSKSEDHKLASYRSNNHHMQFEPNCDRKYDLNDHFQDMRENDSSVDQPFRNFLPNNQSKAMSMSNLSLPSNNLQSLPKKVCKILPQSHKRKEIVNAYNLTEFDEETFYEDEIAVHRVKSEKCSFERNDTDLSNDSTDSILSDANKEVQELIYQSELDVNVQNVSPKTNYETGFESDLTLERSLVRKETNIIETGQTDINKFSTLGRTAYAPRSCHEISIGDVVKFIRQGGRISRGLVHFVGPLPNRKDTYLGIELEVEDGKHDGIYEEKRYFQCIKNKGVFVAFNKIIMVYSTKI